MKTPLVIAGTVFLLFVLDSPADDWPSYLKDYRRSGTLMYPVAAKNRSYGNKELTLGLTIGSTSKAYPFKELLKVSGNSMSDDIGDESVTIEWSIEDQSARVLNDEGEELASVTAYWFAWFAFHPDTEIFRVAE